jgi:hypothetical protein
VGIWGRVRVAGMAGALAVVGAFTPSVADAQQCVSYFEQMLKGMERDGVPHAGTCAKRNKLMVSLTDMASQQFYAPGSPGARRDIPGKRAGTVAVDPNFASWSKPDFEAYMPPFQDGRWWKDGSKIVFNCQTPIPAGALQQAESFLECARVYSCGAAAAMCGLELARTTNTSDCASISRTCLAANPVPSGTVQGVATAPAPSVPHAGPGTSAPRTPPPPPPPSSLAGMSPACKAQFNAFLEAVDLNDNAKAAAVYDALRATCDAAMRALSQEANVALPERQMGALSRRYFLDCSKTGDCGTAPSTPEQSARAAANAIDVGALMNFGFAAAGFAIGVAGFYAPSPGGSFASSGQFTTINQRARSTYGQGGPVHVAPRTVPSDITGIGRK